MQTTIVSEIPLSALLFVKCLTLSHYCQISDWTVTSDSAEFAQAPHTITMIALRVGGTSDLILVKPEF